MAQRLTEMKLDRVSLVDKGANDRVFAILKRKEEASMPDPADAPVGVVAWLRKQLGLEVVVAKGPATFKEVIAGQELSDALYDSWYTLQDTLWGAIYAYDADGQALSIEAKQALVAQDLDEFKAYLLDAMGSVVSKAQDTPAALARRDVTAVVAKVGKKISGSRLERLTAAAAALTSVLDEVAEVVDEEAVAAEEVPVDKAELTEALTEVVAKANEPIIARLEALEKQKVAKVDGDEEDAPLTLEDRLDTIEKILLGTVESASVRKSLTGQDGGEAAGREPVKKSVFAGILG